MSNSSVKRLSPFVWDGQEIPPGGTLETAISVSESYSGFTVPIPVAVRRGKEDGPAVFITAALHGDEINGAGVVRALIRDERLNELRGTLILVPVVNILGFDRHARYLPDRRDLNRCFPGSHRGSVASRMARLIFEQVVCRSDYGIDLHTAAVRRTNFPNVRADMSDQRCAKLASEFGCEIILDSRGPKKSLRREACRAGVPTIILEAGEVWKVEPAILEYAERGIFNALAGLGMIDVKPKPPRFQVVIAKTTWVRADRGGFLEYHSSPGEMVTAGQPLATNTSLTGTIHNVLTAPCDAFVIGMSTHPAVSPGAPVMNLGHIDKNAARLARMQARLPEGHLHGRTRDDLATNVSIVPAGEEGTEETASN